jgi:hypothetical protein
MTRNRALVLFHHAVSETWPDDLAIPPDVLVGQIPKLLGRGLVPGTADDALAVRRISMSRSMTLTGSYVAFSLTSDRSGCRDDLCVSFVCGRWPTARRA